MCVCIRECLQTIDPCPSGGIERGLDAAMYTEHYGQTAPRGSEAPACLRKGAGIAKNGTEYCQDHCHQTRLLQYKGSRRVAFEANFHVPEYLKLNANLVRESAQTCLDNASR